MSKNIEMNYFNGSGYEVLYPQTNLANVLDYSNYLYNKTEIDSKVGDLSNRISSVETEMGNIDTTIEDKISELDSFSIFSVVLNINFSSATSGNVTLNKKVADCNTIIVDFRNVSGFSANDTWFFNSQFTTNVGSSFFLIYNIVELSNKKLCIQVITHNPVVLLSIL